MSASVRLFAGAAEAIGHASTTTTARTVGDLVTELTALAGDAGRGEAARAEAADVLGRCSFLVAGARAETANTEIPDGALVDVLPPFAGG